MPLTIDIESLFNGRTIESSRIEYKENWNPETTIKTICAFANDIDNFNGGYIIIGIKEKNGQPVLPISGLKDEAIDSIQKDIVEKCHYIEPLYIPRIEVEEYEGKKIIVLLVAPGHDRPYRASKNIFANQSIKSYYIRKGSLTIEANDKQVRELYDNSMYIPFDDRDNPYAQLDDLDKFLIQNHLKQVKSSLYDLSNNMSLEELARDMDLIEGPSERISVKNIGVLMFSRKVNLPKFFPDAYIEIVDMPDPTGTTMTEKVFKGPIQIQLQDALNYIQNNFIVEKIIKSEEEYTTKRFYNYPLPAIKEILANAVYHKDYRIHAPITVTKTPNFLEIKSYPGFDSSITNDMIKSLNIRSYGNYKNRRIGGFLKELGLTEGRNTGIPKTIQSLNENGSSNPLFLMDIERQSLVVRIPIHKSFIDKASNIRITKAKQRNIDEMKKDILSYLTSGDYSQRELAKGLDYKGVSKLMKEALSQLINDDLIEIVGNNKGSKIRLIK